MSDAVHALVRRIRLAIEGTARREQAEQLLRDAGASLQYLDWKWEALRRGLIEQRAERIARTKALLQIRSLVAHDATIDGLSAALLRMEELDNVSQRWALEETRP